MKEGLNHEGDWKKHYRVSRLVRYFVDSGHIAGVDFSPE